MLSRNIAAIAAVALTTSLFAAPADYIKDVKPILAEHCYRCHGASQQKSGMRADTAAFLRTGGDSGPSVVAGKADESLLMKTILGTHDDIAQMPYKKPPLAAAKIAVLRAWINEGAVAPANEEPEKNIHWAFTAPVRPEIPAVTRQGWSQNPIDAFIFARLANEKTPIAPSPEADRITLLRRVSLDLIGLPPTPAEVAAFLADQSADAYGRVVTRLLASPHHGERWARPWLDVARYADSNGYSIDAPRQIWKYRDWVVAALNRDLPYDQFVIEQLGGDLLTNPTVDQQVATGFNRNTQINQEGGIDPEQFRIEAVLDRVGTFGTAFLGLTVGCAQCHDHKFDPITQREFYQLYAIFNNTVDDGHGKSTPGGTLAFASENSADETALRELETQQADFEKFLDEHKGPVVAWFAALDGIGKTNLGGTAREALDVPWANLSFAQKRAVFAAYPQVNADFKARQLKHSGLERRPSRRLTTLVMSELKKPRESVIFIKGDFTRRGDPVQPGTPAILPPLAVATPNRLDLARWLVDPANPLTARVTVNHVWQHLFSRGLVATVDNFGVLGEPPSHPELLDYLATEFVQLGWSRKKLIRLIVTSATYRQSSVLRQDLAERDPQNVLLARQSRQRLEAEIVRDVFLASSGLLNPRIGGPSIYPALPPFVLAFGRNKSWPETKGPEKYRRGLNIHLRRNVPYPMLATFDESDASVACLHRERSNSPLQALTLLNDPVFVECHERLGEQLAAQPADTTVEARLRHAFERCLSRPPAAAELAASLSLGLPLPMASVGGEPTVAEEEAAEDDSKEE